MSCHAEMSSSYITSLCRRVDSFGRLSAMASPFVSDAAVAVALPCNAEMSSSYITSLCQRVDSFGRLGAREVSIEGAGEQSEAAAVALPCHANVFMTCARIRTTSSALFGSVWAPVRWFQSV